MAVDDLLQPLGAARNKLRDLAAQRWRKRLPKGFGLAVLTAVMAVFLVVAIGWAVLIHNPLGGEPYARIAIVTPVEKPAGAPPGQNAVPAAAAPSTPSSPVPSVSVIDGRTGRSEQVAVAAPPAEGMAQAPDTRLVEKTRYGTIPRIATDGARPAEIYARPAPNIPPGRQAMPRIAIVVGGLGISATGTSEATSKLREEITLAFAPYGVDLGRVVARARTFGHEVLLQVPMEPFDYPDNDPGPQTLLTSLTGDQNIDRLYWFLSRFPGFIGVVNYMGARFTSSESALSPVLREITKRGLLYVDDGTSQRSVTREMAGGLGMAFARADVVLDGSPVPAEIDAALRALERTASERGSAIGFATAMPLSIEQIAKWARDVEQRGFILVPLSALVRAGKKA